MPALRKSRKSDQKKETKPRRTRRFGTTLPLRKAIGIDSGSNLKLLEERKSRATEKRCGEAEYPDNSGAVEAADRGRRKEAHEKPARYKHHPKSPPMSEANRRLQKTQRDKSGSQISKKKAHEKPGFHKYRSTSGPGSVPKNGARKKGKERTSVKYP